MPVQDKARPSETPQRSCRSAWWHGLEVLGTLCAIVAGSSACSLFVKPDEAPVADSLVDSEEAPAEFPGEMPEAAEEPGADVVEPDAEVSASEGSESSKASPSDGGATDALATDAPVSDSPLMVGNGLTSPPDAEPALGNKTQDPFLRAVETMKGGRAKYPRALKQFDEAISENPRLAEAYFNKGVILYDTGELESAAKAYRKALELKPTLIQATANLATLYREQGQIDRAMGIVEDALQGSPDDAALLNSRALSLAEAGRADEAVETIRRILKINAMNVDAFVNLGCIYLAEQDYEMARLVFEKAILSVPAASSNPYIRHNLGVAYLGLGDRRAAQQFEMALAGKPDLVPSLINRAYLHLEIQEFDEAADLLRRAIAVEPDRIETRVDLGVALRGLQDLEGAAIQYEQALAVDNDHRVALYNYAVLLDDYEKDYSRAIEYYERLKNLARSKEEKDEFSTYVRKAEYKYELEKRRADRTRRQQEQRKKQQGQSTPKTTNEPLSGSENAPAQQGGDVSGGSGATGVQGGESLEEDQQQTGGDPTP